MAATVMPVAEPAKAPIPRRTQGASWMVIARIVVVVTDHGHRPEGGHGGDTPAERASFVIATGIGDPGPQWLSRLEPHALVDLLLAELAS